MANAAPPRCRLCLVTPPAYDARTFRPLLADALAGGDVASLIITPPADALEFQHAAEAFTGIAIDRNVAAIVVNEARIANYIKADGVHLERGAEPLGDTIAGLRKSRKIVGIGNLRTRHEALEAGAAEPDYLFFGRLDGDFTDVIFPKALELAAWWSSVTIIPAIIMGGRQIASVSEAAEANVAFVALSEAVWAHPEGPAKAVAEAAERLAASAEAAA